VTQSIVYGAGIILTFTAVGVTLAVMFGAAGLNRFAADPWLNLGVTALFIAFALSLFGVYELALPSRLLTLAAKADQGRGRFAGTLLLAANSMRARTSPLVAPRIQRLHWYLKVSRHFDRRGQTSHPGRRPARFVLYRSLDRVDEDIPPS